MTALVDCLVKLANLEELEYVDYIEVTTFDVIHE